MSVTVSGVFLIVGAPVVLVVIVWALIGAQRPRPKEGGWYAESPVLSRRQRMRRQRMLGFEDGAGATEQDRRAQDRTEPGDTEKGWMLPDEAEPDLPAGADSGTVDEGDQPPLP